MSKEAMKLALEAIYSEKVQKAAVILEEALAKQEVDSADSAAWRLGYDAGVARQEAIYESAKQEQGEPVALKKGECWPEEVMRQWDYWRKEIANGHKGSAPRDWFEGLSELKLIDTTPQPIGFAVMERPLVGLTDEEVIRIRDDMTLDIRSHLDFYRHCEAKLKEKNNEICSKG